MMNEATVLNKRAGGVLCHITSLPSEYGIGDLGPGAREWINWLTSAGCSVWQVLPVGTTGYGNSPYQSFSAHAGNHLLISPADLLADGFLTEGDLEPIPDFPADQVDFGKVYSYKRRVLTLAAERLLGSRDHPLFQEYQRYQEEHQSWLYYYALFMSLKAEHDMRPWAMWPEELRSRDPSALAAARERLAHFIAIQEVLQFFFTRQWQALKRSLRSQGVTIVGDMPIFVSHDSVDVWARPEMFYLDSSGQPSVVAGVPPDYFSRTGQRWGNPLYRWDVMQEDGYAWWISRIKASLELVDILRLDHFRGFEAYWEIPSRCPTAEEGRWVSGPGSDLLSTLEYSFGSLPLIAEDLGVITPEVVELRDRFGLPGMKVLQFGLEGSPDDPFLPHNYIQNCVAYTGTHDNDTSLGWYDSSPAYVRDFARRYLATTDDQIAWEMVRSIWASVADYAIAPLQDVVNLGTEGRMNYPGTLEGNWEWRVQTDQLTPELAGRLQELSQVYARS